MARKFHAKYAIMIVQSFVEDDNKNHFKDFKEFIEAYGVCNQQINFPIFS
jgi:hypothetical protein